ncbi:MAG: enoyl-CoA hydratase/isomerase family protein [Clostridium sp.]|nr:enoyl-CoA hydratase/isomerase family protein [Clostridium sp.]
MYQYKEYQHLTVTRQGAVAKIMLNRPKVRNAISDVTLEELDSVFHEVERDDDVKVVIFGGEGKAFCSGVDLFAHASEIKNHVPSEWLVHFDRFYRVGMTMFHLKKILICAVHGAAFGFGFDLALVGDFTLMAESTVLGLTENDRLSADMMMMLPYVTSMKNAKRLMFMYEKLTAQDALEMGLVNKLVPDDKLMEEAEAWAARLAVVPSITLEQNKRAINHAYDLAGLSQAFEFNMHTGAHIEQSADPVARAERNAFILEHGVSAWLKQHNEEMAKKAAEQEK